MLSDAEVSARARALWAAIEPFAGHVYFSPEANAEYTALGFGTGRGSLPSGVQTSNRDAYNTSRGSALGHASGEVVAAAFAVFEPEMVAAAVERGWALADPDTIAAARRRGATNSLRRMIGEKPDGLGRVIELLNRASEPLQMAGRPLFAGLCARDLPADPLGRAWALADRLREYRGDSHTAAWIAAGFDAVEIGLLSEQWWDLPPRTYVYTRAWTDTQLDAATRRLQERGMLDGERLSPAGRLAREQIELATDYQMRPAVEALNGDIDELLGAVGRWSAAIQAAGGYPDLYGAQLAARVAAQRQQP
ncbi:MULTISPECIES: hypothetical protein [unclassified Mycobacterium]|uniref:SCO6745 family protein n=1 Tax=unclassified Mycobacterium TaxID=2642494 RepID=UPI00068A069B|nr:MULTISPECIES: hypothetical protein [unclassified Mycobacterium]SEA60810.1 hypothetical protein SAMN04488580_103430 [Mycobacterium sp. 283mftsu]